jgi:type IV secretory pathway TrbF-like protein
MDQDRSFERIQTKGYAGRQRWFQDMEQLILERRNRLGRIMKRDSGLIVSIIILTGLLAVSVLGNIVQGMTGVRTEVQVLRIDQLGNVQPLMKLSQMPAAPEELQVTETLTTWIKMVRTITPAGRIMNDMADWLKDYTSQVLLNRLEGYRKEQMLRQQTGIQVSITKPTVQRLSGPRSYHVEWDECTWSPEGRLILEQSAVWKATVTVADFQSQAVKKARDLRIQQQNWRNPLGIVVDTIEWKAQPFLTIQIAEPRCAKS